MKKLIPFIALFIPALLCGCSASGASQKNDVIEYSSAESIQPASPSVTPTLEELAEDTATLLKSAQDSYNTMNENAEKETASQDGVKAAEAVSQKYKSRLDELEEADLSTYSYEELQELQQEISGIITAIREARDLLP